MLPPDAWVALAEVMRPHGVRGEVRLRPFVRESDLLLGVDDVCLRFPDGEEHEVSVDSARRAGDAILMKLCSVDDRDRAGELRGALVCARRGDFPEPSEGEFYACDVAGARVTFEGREIGRVREVASYPSVDVLRVDAAGDAKPLEVPLVEGVVRSVDVVAGVVDLATLDGVERG